MGIARTPAELYLVLGFLVVIGLLIESATIKRLPPIIAMAAVLGWIAAGLVVTQSLWYLAMLGLVVLLAGVLGPLQTKSSFLISDELSTDPLDEEGARLGEHPTLAHQSERIVSMGFREAGRLFQSGFEKAASRYFLNEAGDVLASAVFHRRGFVGVKFLSGSAGRMVETTNWPSYQTWPPPPQQTVFYHPLCEDPERLLELHRKHISQIGLSSLVRFEAGAVVERIRQMFRIELSHAAELGYFYRSPDGYRLTLGGTYRILLASLLVQYRRNEYRAG